MMIIKSKLNPTRYKIADPEKYLKGDWWRELDPVFAGRLAYAAMDTGCIMTSNSAYRSIEEQTRLYQMYQEYLRTGKGNVKLAAKPGTSRHNFRLAVDTSTQPIRSMTSTELKKYGLCKPIRSEGWHVEPIETGTTANWKKYIPDIEEEEEEMAEKVYKTLDEVPAWGKETVKKIIAKGGITPTENSTPTINDDEINLTHSMLRIYVSLDKMNKI